jgi:plastocyanin
LVQLPIGRGQQFRATVRGASDESVTWSVLEGREGGTVSQDGTYIGSSVAGTFHVVAASNADPTKSASGTVVVANTDPKEISVSIDPQVVEVAAGSLVHFTAAVRGPTDTRVRWSASAGTIQQDGTWQAGNAPGTFSITATSLTDPTRSASATARVEAISISIDPQAVDVAPGSAVHFTATVRGTTNTRVRWSASAGTIQQDGTWQAGNAPGTFSIMATSAADPTKSASATARVAPRVAISIEPDQISVPAGSPTSYKFQAHVTGTADAAVSWAIQEGSRGGTIDAAGQYRPPFYDGTFHVTVTSHADPTKTATAVVTITLDMSDHGGPVMPATRTFALWWGDTAAFAPDVRTTLEQLLRGLNGSSYLAIANEYLFGARATTSFAGSLFDPTAPPRDDPAPNVIADAACRALDRNGITPRLGDLVFVNTSNFPTGTTYCGWHYSGVCHGQEILIAFMPNASGTFCDSQLDFCKSGLSKSAISMSLIATHELLEAITDPLMNTWYRALESGSQWEIADQCGEAVCAALSTGTYALPSLYSNAVHRCVPR